MSPLPLLYGNVLLCLWLLLGVWAYDGFGKMTRRQWAMLAVVLAGSIWMIVMLGYVNQRVNL